jgi:hypothetical protein
MNCVAGLSLRCRGLLVVGDITTVELLLVAGAASPFLLLILTLHHQIYGQERPIPFRPRVFLKSPCVFMK